MENNAAMENSQNTESLSYLQDWHSQTSIALYWKITQSQSASKTPKRFPQCTLQAKKKSWIITTIFNH